MPQLCLFLQPLTQDIYMKQSINMYRIKLHRANIFIILIDLTTRIMKVSLSRFKGIL